MSTRDIEDALEEVTGYRLLSRTAVSQIAEVLWDEYGASVERDLSSSDVEYLFLDAVYQSLHCPAARKRTSKAEARRAL